MSGESVKLKVIFISTDVIIRFQQYRYRLC